MNMLTCMDRKTEQETLINAEKNTRGWNATLRATTYSEHTAVFSEQSCQPTIRCLFYGGHNRHAFCQRR